MRSVSGLSSTNGTGRNSPTSSISESVTRGVTRLALMETRVT